jgi:hypothetical protein
MGAEGVVTHHPKDDLKVSDTRDERIQVPAEK